MKLLANKQDVLDATKAFDEFMEIESTMSEEVKAIMLIGFGACLQSVSYTGIETTELVLKFQKYAEGL